MSKKFNLTSGTFIGGRKYQEDFYDAKYHNDILLCALCDGMGGLKKGDIASQATVKKFILDFETYYLNMGLSKENSFDDFLLDEIDILDDYISTLYQSEKLGTTFIGAIFKDSSLQFVSVGDSDILLIRNNMVKKLNRNHNYFLDLNRKLSSHQITKEQYDVLKKDGKKLISFIGKGNINLMDLEELDLYDEDYILICSDGLTNNLNYNEITHILNKNSTLALKKDALIEKSKKNVAKQDNTSLILVKVLNDAE